MKAATVREWTDACGGRRFLMTVGCGMVNTALLMLGYMDASIYRDLTIATVAVYIGGNTYEKVKESASE